MSAALFEPSNKLLAKDPSQKNPSSPQDADDLLSSAIDNDMGDARLALYIFNRGVPKIFSKEDGDTKELFHELLDWWINLMQSLWLFDREPPDKTRSTTIS